MNFCPMAASSIKMIFSLHARRDFARIPLADQTRILSLLGHVAEHGPEGVCSPDGHAQIDAHLFELKAGDYRVIYRMDDDEMLVISVFTKSSVFDE